MFKDFDELFDSAEEIAKDQLLAFLKRMAIASILGANPNVVLIYIVTEIVDKIFEEAIEPLIDHMYIEGRVFLCKKDGKLTIRKIQNAQNDDEIWDIIHSEY